MIQIQRLPQLGASIAEPLAVTLTADLMARGLMRSQSHSWDDKVTVALFGADVVGLIAWRPQPWQRQAFVTLGGVWTPHRRRGVYRRLFEDLVEQLAAEHPDLDQIASGHHIDNHESRAMHLALGRRQESIGYVFPLVRAVRTEERP